MAGHGFSLQQVAAGGPGGVLQLGSKTFLWALTAALCVEFCMSVLMPMALILCPMALEKVVDPMHSVMWVVWLANAHDGAARHA